MVTAAVLVILGLLIWFVLPHFSMGGHDLFSSKIVRILILFFVITAYHIQIVISFFQKHQAQAFSVILSGINSFIKICIRTSKTVSEHSKENYLNLRDRIKRDHKRRRMRKLPWYLVVGSKQSGKKSILKNLGLYFSRPEHIGEDAVNYIQQFPDFDWWFSDQGLFVDVMTDAPDEENNRWKGFLRLLKRERNNKPLNGVLLVFSLVDLITFSNKVRQEFLQSIAVYLRDIHQKFKSQVPVYLIFNKCDQVEGFMEFFNDLSKEELRQVWGMTLPFDIGNNQQQVQSWLHQHYLELIEQLKKRVMWSLDTERSIRGRELINAFPQQMQLLKKPIEAFIQELFGVIRYQRALQLRGVYFTSCDQEQSQSYDFVLQAMSKKFQLIPPRFERPVRLGESYFIRSLFYKVLQPEAHLLGDSERSKRMRRLGYRLVILGCPIVLAMVITGMATGYRSNKKNLIEIENDIGRYKQALINFDQGSTDLTSTFILLKPLNRANRLYHDDSQSSLNFLFLSHLVGNQTDAALERTLQLIFLPRVAAQIENSLNQNIADQNLLYATLKGYLAFSSKNNTPRFSVRAPVEVMWNESLKTDQGRLRALKYYLDKSLRARLTKLPLDNDLIDRVRNQLQHVVPSERAYGLLALRASVNHLSNLYLSIPVGNDFNRIFVEQENEKPILSLYTREGYRKVFLKQYQSISNEVAEDNRDIGLANESNVSQNASQISTSMQKQYQAKYLKSWDDAIDQISIRPFDGLNGAIDTLTLLSGELSPLKKLLNLIHDNTSSVEHDKVFVADRYQAINYFTDSSWAKTTKSLSQINDYLKKLQQSPDPDKASFDAAVLLLQGKSNNPIQSLNQIAKNAPNPIRSWLEAIAQNSWNAILQGAHQYLNTAWQHNVMQFYQQHVQDRYPLNQKSNSDLTMKDFNTFFGYQGILDSYFTQYIKPFINTDKSEWQPYHIGSQNIGLSKNAIVLFQNAATIREDYFPKGSQSASFSFSIRPLSLDSQASSMQLVIGDDHLIYSHGPATIDNITWPLPYNSEHASLYITGFDDNQFGYAASGPWALFKILRHGVFKAAHDDGTYHFYINFHGLHGSYRITGSGKQAIFKLSDFYHFKLPHFIAPAIEDKGEAK